MHESYHNHEIRQLRDQQARFAPREKKLEQADRAEALLYAIEPGREYSFEYVCYRITGFRPDAGRSPSMSGRLLIEDLRRLVEDLSDSAEVPIDQVNQPVYTVEELSERFNVADKTISRWRQQGLVSRRFVFPGGRKRVGFLHSSVEAFTKMHGDKVARGHRFSQLSKTDKEDIVQRARMLAARGMCPGEVARQIAGQVHRSVETIRYTLRQFDERHPEIAIFPDQTGPLNLEIKERIFAEFNSGKSADQIARRYCRTRSTVYRVINEMRYQAIMDLPLDYIDSAEFHRKGAERRILESELPAADAGARKTRVPSGLPRYLASLYEVPLLTREQEQYLFRKFNFLKYRAHKLRQSLDPARPRASEMDQVEQIYQESIRVKNRIVQANLRLVVSIAKRHVSANDDFFQLVSDGNVSLIRAVEKFDYARGNKFSTYASWAIMKNFARTIPDEFRQRDRFRATSDELFLARADERGNHLLLEAEQRRREEQISRILEQLDNREQQIIISRFGLDHRHEPQTLKEVGEEMGVTKERVRQIEVRALGKLRAAAEREQIEWEPLEE